MRLTNRDIQVIEFLKEFRVASTSDLMELFGFTQPSCNRRMKQLMEEFIRHLLIWYQVPEK